LVSRLYSTTGDVVEAPAPLPFALLLAPQLAHHSGFAISPNIAPSLQALLYRVVPALFGTQEMLHSSSGRRCCTARLAGDAWQRELPDMQGSFDASPRIGHFIQTTNQRPHVLWAFRLGYEDAAACGWVLENNGTENRVKNVIERK
jgi:hypothetical protein